MYKKRFWLGAVLLVALGYNIGLGLAALAQNQNRQLLPVVFGPVANAQGATLVTLVENDSSFVNAAVVPGTSRVLLAYIDRANGNRLHIVEDMGNRVVEVPAPIGLFGTLVADEAPSGPSPSFTFPGPKQADGTIVFAGGLMHIYATARDTGDETGPFKLKRLSMPVPAKPPQSP